MSFERRTYHEEIGLEREECDGDRGSLPPDRSTFPNAICHDDARQTLMTQSAYDSPGHNKVLGKTQNQKGLDQTDALFVGAFLLLDVSAAPSYASFP